MIIFMWIIQDAATECDDFQTAILTKSGWIKETKKN